MTDTEVAGPILIGLAILVVGGLLFGFGTCAHRDMQRDDAQAEIKLRLETELKQTCIRSGRTLIGENCVRVAP